MWWRKRDESKLGIIEAAIKREEAKREAFTEIEAEAKDVLKEMSGHIATNGFAELIVSAQRRK